MTHLVKVHGGNMCENWTNAAMALHHLEGLDARLQQARKRGDELMALLNQLPGIKITPLPSGTNIYSFEFSKEINSQQVAAALAKDNIRIGRANNNGLMRFTINETILYQDLNKLHNSFRQAIKNKI